MISFAIDFDGDGRSPSKQVRFVANSLEEAFQIIERQGVPGDITLWDGDRRLANIWLIKPGFWQLAP